MTLNPVLAEMIEQRKALGVSFTDMTPQQAREMMAAAPAPPRPEVYSTEDRMVPGPDVDIPVRIYRSSAATPTRGVVYLHGGGFVLGDLESHDAVCRRLALAADATVVAVDYRLAPEHPFPAGLRDAYAATAWVVDNASQLGIDPARVGVAGDSAGANLATVTTHLAHDRGGPQLAFQVLVYPTTDYNFDRPSVIANGKDYIVSVEDMHWFWGHYVDGPESFENPLVIPFKREDLSGLPPALIITAGYDFLRDEGEAYGLRLAEAGVKTTISRYPAMAHGFIGMSPFVADSDAAMAEIGDAIKRATPA